MATQRVLVTGASGFLGARLAAQLVAAGHEVHAVARQRPRTHLGLGTLHWHELDLGEPQLVAQLVESVRPETIYHLASLVVGRRDLELVVPTFSANLASTVHLLSAAASGAVGRIVLAGSMEEPAADEAPSSPYAAAKGAASLYARFFHTVYGLPVVTARIFMVYGPGQRDRAKLVPATIAAALAGEAARISSGARPVDWIYVDDAVDGLLALAAAPGIEGRTLDLGSGELVTVREVVERIARRCQAPAPEIGALPDRRLEAVRCADVEATFAATGWRPRVGLDDGLERTIAALRAR